MQLPCLPPAPATTNVSPVSPQATTAAAPATQAAAAPQPAEATPAVPSAAPASAPNPGDNSPRALYERVTPSLVAVQYTFTGETVQQDLIVPGIVVNDQGLVMIPLEAVSEALPDEQLKKFKIIIPRLQADNEELDAEFQGRDERCGLAFVKVKETGKTKHTWTPLHFEPAPAEVGDTVYSVGMLSRSGGYHSFLAPSVVSANLRGPVKQVLVAGGGLASPGAPVFNARGQAIGLVLEVPPATLLLDDEVKTQQQQTQRLLSELATNRYYMPASEFMIGLQSPPTPEHPVPLAWSGLPEQLLSGLTQNDAALFNLTGQTAVQINDILPNSPAERGGLKNKDIIIKVDGQPIERGDRPEELPGILRHELIRHKPGDVVTFTVISKKGDEPHDVKITLEPQPQRANTAKRYWNEEIGFGVREMVLLDRYYLKLKKNEKNGVLVTVLKEGGSASSAGLHPYDMITQVNGEPVTDLESFKTTYENFRRDHEHDAIVLVVHRGGNDETIRIEPPQ
jgi:serine protease Do